MLRIIQPRAAGVRRQAHQQLGQRIAGDAQERDEAARFHVAEGVLLQDAHVEAELGLVAAVHPGRDCPAPGRRWWCRAADCCVSSPSGENPVTLIWLRPKSRGLLDSSGRPTARLMLRPKSCWKTPSATRLKPARTSLSSDGREDVGLADHGVLRAAGHVVAEARHQREAGAGERLEQVAVAEAVAEREFRRRRERWSRRTSKWSSRSRSAGEETKFCLRRGAVGQRIQRRDRRRRSDAGAAAES